MACCPTLVTLSPHPVDLIHRPLSQMTEHWSFAGSALCGRVSARRPTLPKQLQERRQTVELVDMIRGRVARESHEKKSARADLAELLRAHRSPLQHGTSFEVEFADQVVGGL